MSPVMLNPARFGASGSTVYSTTVLADIPVVYYRLGESSGTSAADSSGNSRTGTYFGSPTLGAAGISGGGGNTAVTFSGSSQYVNVPNTGLDTGQSFSGECWVKGSLNTGERVFFSRWDSPTATQRYIFSVADATNGQPVVFIHTSTGYFSATVATNVLNGAWHHLAFTVDASNLKLYLDGSLVATTAKSGTSEVGGVLTLAARNNPISFFAGTIDEVAVYASTLTAGQVSAHYAAGI